MEKKQRRYFGSRTRWTIGSLMVVVALSALVIALVRPFVSQPAPSEEGIVISFKLQKTRSADGQPLMGFVPNWTFTKKAAPAAKP